MIKKGLQLTYLIIVILVTLFIQKGYSQNFTGTYKCGKTSFQDNLDSNKNYMEETLFNIAIALNKSEGIGELIIQDPRIPDKLLTYKVVPKAETIDLGIKSIYIYRGNADHLGEDNPCNVVLTVEGEIINLMVADKGSSQMFLDIKKEL